MSHFNKLAKFNYNRHFRAEEVLRLVNYKEPSMSATEKAEADELKKMNSRVKDLSIRLEQLKTKKERQSSHLKEYDNIEKKKEIVLSKTQEESIKTCMGQM